MSMHNISVFICRKTSGEATVATKTSTPEDIIMQYVHDNGSINRKPSENLLALSQTAAGKILRKLVEQGELSRDDQSRNVRYFVSK